MISIITVTYNASVSIKGTLTSILNQHYTNYELIIIDGCSNDGTIEIIQTYIPLFKKRGISLTFISEKDNGIYDAMNKGARICNGDYLYFLNAGDELVDKYVLDQVSLSFNGNNIVFGDVILKQYNMGFYKKSSCIDDIIREMPFCHQSVFIPKSLVTNEMYDIRYKICADYDFFIKCYRNNISFTHVNIPISYYLIGGYSSKDNNKAFIIEKNLVLKQNGYETKDIYNDDKKIKIIMHRIVTLKVFVWIYKIHLKNNGWYYMKKGESVE